MVLGPRGNPGAFFIFAANNSAFDLPYTDSVKHLRNTLILMLGTVGTAGGHFSLLAPASALQTENGGKGPAPCGDGVESNIVTAVRGGHALPIQLQEFIFHPGHYRIALSVNSRAELPPDPDVVDSDGVSISASIQKPVRIPVLADGMFAHTSPPPGDWRGEVTLPNINCDRCTIQIIEFMAEHGAPFFYHHCADLKIQADTSLPPADAAWPASHPTKAAVSHLADGGGWQTLIALVNLDSVPADFAVKFWGESGDPLLVGITGNGNSATFVGTLPVGGSKTIRSDGSPPRGTSGWAEISSPQSIQGVAIFRFNPTGQEASVPLASSGGRRWLLPFESGEGLALGVAVTNLSATDTTTVALTIRDESGTVVATPAPVALGLRQHASFVLGVPQSVQRGVLELISASADILVLGIRSSGGTFTSIVGMGN